MRWYLVYLNIRGQMLAKLIAVVVVDKDMECDGRMIAMTEDIPAACRINCGLLVW